MQYKQTPLRWLHFPSSASRGAGVQEDWEKETESSPSGNLTNGADCLPSNSEDWEGNIPENEMSNGRLVWEVSIRECFNGHTCRKCKLFYIYIPSKATQPDDSETGILKAS